MTENFKDFHKKDTSKKTEDINNSVPKEVKEVIANDEFKTFKKELADNLDNFKKEVKEINNQAISEIIKLNHKINHLEKKISESQATQKKFLLEILQIGDDLSRALDPYFNKSQENIDGKGVMLINNNLNKALEKYNIFEINPLGELFDPTKHNAIGSKPAKTQDENNKVCEVIEKGYLWNNQVLRVAQVFIAQWQE